MLSSSMPADDVSSCVVGGNREYYRPNPISFFGQDFRVGPLARGSNDERPPALEDAINLEFCRLKWHCKCVFTEKEARPKPSLGPVFRLPHARPSAPSSSWNDGKLQITAEQLPYVTREQKTVPMTAA